ncbi:MAG: cytochrome b5 domain-containing protein [Bacillota bacterium]
MKSITKYLLMAALLVSAVSLSACSKPAATAPVQVSTTTPYTLTDIKAHATKSNCWTAIDGKVYNLTAYIASGQHKPIITDGCGIDSSSLFNNVGNHSSAQAQALLPTMVIGYLAQ